MLPRPTTAKLETARLILRPLELADADQAQKLFAHWEIVRFLNPQVPWPYPPDGSLTYFRDVALPAIARGEQWTWTLRLKTNPEQMIGLITLQKVERVMAVEDSGWGCRGRDKGS